MRFAERNIASSFEFAQKLMQAKDARRWRRLHADYVQQSDGRAAPSRPRN